MATITAAELLGPSPDSGVAAEFLACWFREFIRRPDGPFYVALTPFDSATGAARPSAIGEVGRVLSAIRDSGIDDLIYGRPDFRFCNLYFAVGLLRRLPDRSKNRAARGSAADMGRFPGVVADLDVEPGKFGSQGEWMGLVRRLWMLGAGPSAIVLTGSGGGHVYWRVAGGLEPAEFSRLCRRLNAWFRIESGVAVDGIGDPTRILRVPGSLRFPSKRKAGGSGVPQLVSVHYLEPSATVTVARLDAVTADSWSAEESRVAGVKRRARVDDDDALAVLAEVAAGERGGYWDRLLAVAGIPALEDDFARTHSWARVLEPFGYRRQVDASGAVREPDSQGRVVWARPGRAGSGARSLVTDWVESPDVASVLSRSPETGLQRLGEAGIPATKLRVWVELYAGGDLAGFIRTWAGERVE